MENRNAKFLELFEKYKHKLFLAQEINGFKILKCIHQKEIFDFCLEMAQSKSENTIKHGEDYKSRTPAQRLSDAFNGIYAETYVHFLLLLGCKIHPNDILQFDLVRKSWKHPKDWQPKENEYDIRIIRPHDYFSIEIKSSTNQTCIGNFLTTYHLLGGHINNISEEVDINDYYIQVYYQAKRKVDENNPLTPEEIIGQNTNMYIVSGASNKMLYQKGKIGTLKQVGNENKKNAMQRISDFIYNEQKNIQSLLNKGSKKDLYNFIKNNEEILNEPIYIQMVNKDADDINGIIKSLKIMHSSLLLSETLCENVDFFEERQLKIHKDVQNNIVDKYYLDVDFKEKDTVKQLGAKWDGNLGLWYFTNPKDKEKFTKWLFGKYKGVDY